MTEVRSVTFVPQAGSVVELPTDFSRIDCGYVGGGANGADTLKIAVSGTNDSEPFVILKANGGGDLEESAQVLCSDVTNGALWYCLPRDSAYGGGAE